MMKRLALLVALTLFGFASRAQEAPIDARAAWHPGAQFMQKVRERCAQAASARYGECLIEQMPAAGASPQAVAFSRRLLRESGQTGWLRGAHPAGSIAVAAVEYPLRANENRGWLILDGEPPRIDVDDPQWLPYEGLAHDATYASLIRAHPRLAVFPDDRARGWPLVETTADGGFRIVVRHRLLDGCHACARLGTATVALDFDSNGQLVGPALIRVEAAR
jgi:hypothetical protein